MNRQGAVSILLPDGSALGVKPGEFDLVDYPGLSEDWLDVPKVFAALERLGTDNEALQTENEALQTVVAAERDKLTEQALDEARAEARLTKSVTNERLRAALAERDRLRGVIAPTEENAAALRPHLTSPSATGDFEMSAANRDVIILAILTDQQTRAGMDWRRLTEVERKATAFDSLRRTFWEFCDVDDGKTALACLGEFIGEWEHAEGLRQRRYRPVCTTCGRVENGLCSNAFHVAPDRDDPKESSSNQPAQAAGGPGVGAPGPDAPEAPVPEQPIPTLKRRAADTEPLPMLLWCPTCHERHIDAGAFATRPHHTHACQGCGNVWRPALVPTVGVQFLPGFKDGAPAPSTTTLVEPATSQCIYDPWRTGRQVRRTIYDAHGSLIGLMDTPGLAAAVVEAVNRPAIPPRVLTMLKGAVLCGRDGFGHAGKRDCPGCKLLEEAEAMVQAIEGDR